jgi:hypothetical protein
LFYKALRRIMGSGWWLMEYGTVSDWMNDKKHIRNDSEMKNTRLVYKCTGDYMGLIKAQYIKAGDEIMLYESDGTPVYGNNGEQVFVVTKNAYLNEDGIWTFEYNE